MSVSLEDRIQALTEYDDWREDRLLTPPAVDLNTYLDELEMKGRKALIERIHAFALTPRGESQYSLSAKMERIAELTAPAMITKEINE